ncbi:MAG: dihydroxy-acid dehydratase [Candidatus Abyssobacteria bacterium SURF_5]|uniref:Dihydroxy-acid dehydratase n=1 Tax=Abyssobacteria bacterium (strain SURF_5) TaxID=2093360 RepID=A0A3A4P526_ABYX5|nr:MAG: dihydroxy-acid dehydratase [Candidatus Abyssubacteria bacterium SURF_5]
MKKLEPEQASRALSLLMGLRTHRFFYKASGFIDAELGRPLVAIANTMQDAGVGHMHLGQVAEAVKAGIYLGGGTPIEFNTIGPCGGYCQKRGIDDLTMLYDLPQRDVIADSVEVQMRNYGADGLVCIGTCDKSIPGLWLGAARMDLPTIFVTGGPAYPGTFDGEPTVFPTDVILRCLNDVLSGAITDDEFHNTMAEMEGKWITSCGACPELTTANTVQMATEVMGLCLPGTSTIPGPDIERLRKAKEAGVAIVKLIREGARFSDFVTEEAIQDAARLIMATSAGTNGILHLLSLSKAMGLNVDINTFARISDQTPYFCPIRPSGPYTMVDLNRAGGPFAVLKRIETEIAVKRPTAGGKTVGEVLSETVIADDNVIRPLPKSLAPHGGIVVLRGNLAPRGSLSRFTIAGNEKQRFRGPCKCYDTQQAAIMGILSDGVSEGDVLVVRYEGPRGGPGFSENFQVVLLLEMLGLRNVAVVTDSRFSGATVGALYVGYITPEAQIGGPLAAVEEGDFISISIPDREINLEVSDGEMKQRLARWQPPPPRVASGILVDWHLLATQFDEGAMVQRNIHGSP